MRSIDAEDQAYQLYQAWKTLSEAEGRAIQAADWPAVTECQRGKLLLQRRLSALEKSPNALQTPAPLSPRLRAVVEELVEMEKQNEVVLAAQRRQAEREDDRWQNTRRQLHQVHRAYAPAKPPHWSSYS